MEDRVILDDMDDLGRPQGSYPECFMSSFLFLAEIYKFVVFVKKSRIQTDIHQTDRHTLEKFNIDKLTNCPGVGYCARPLSVIIIVIFMVIIFIIIMTGDIEDRVIHDVMDVLGRPL